MQINGDLIVDKTNYKLSDFKTTSCGTMFFKNRVEEPVKWANVRIYPSSSWCNGDRISIDNEHAWFLCSNCKAIKVSGRIKLKHSLAWDMGIMVIIFYPVGASDYTVYNIYAQEDLLTYNIDGLIIPCPDGYDACRVYIGKYTGDTGDGYRIETTDEDNWMSIEVL